MGHSQVKYWVGFNIVEGIGPARVRSLLSRFGDAQSAWCAPSAELERAGLGRRALRNLLAARSGMDLDAIMASVERCGASALTWESAAYPPILLQIDDPPPVLYVRGQIVAQDEWAVAVVGTRQATTYGKEVTRRLAGALARNGITVVSGLARGIDAHAHEAAIDAGGRTIAVLGCGVDVTYPASNARLAARIIEAGALISDYPLGTKPAAANFPPRNRIISGMSLGTLVTEAGTRSGALITVHFALDQNRETFAVPGSVLAKSSVGTNLLIQRGEAKLVTNVQDMLEELNLTMISQQLELREIVPENEQESTLLRHISAEPVHVDDLHHMTGLTMSEVSSVLTLMELKGMVRQTGNMSYVLARETPVRYSLD